MKKNVQTTGPRRATTVRATRARAPPTTLCAGRRAAARRADRDTAVNVRSPSNRADRLCGGWGPRDARGAVVAFSPILILIVLGDLLCRAESHTAGVRTNGAVERR